MTREYGDKAGRIDVTAWRELADTHIRVLPCPGHKSGPKNWVHKTVPLLDKGGRGTLKAAS